MRTGAERACDVTALIEGLPDPAARRHSTNADLLSESEVVARALLGRFAPGERIAVWAYNIPEWVVLEFGAELAGITLVTVNPAYRSSELSYVLKQSRASGIFLLSEYRGNPMAATLEQTRPHLPELREVVLFSDWSVFCGSGAPTERLPEVRPEDAAQIQYTSGTTGFPKGVVLHHRGITNNARLFAERVEIATGDVWVNPMPMFHTAGCVLLTRGPIQHGATQVLMPFFDPGLQLALIVSERGTLLGGVPTMLIAMLDHPDVARRDLSSVSCAPGVPVRIPKSEYHSWSGSVAQNSCRGALGSVFVVGRYPRESDRLARLAHQPGNTRASQCVRAAEMLGDVQELGRRPPHATNQAASSSH